MIAAMIIAAGTTAGQNNFQPEKEIGTITAIQRIVLSLRQSGIQRITVICGEGDSSTEKLVSHMNLIFLRHVGQGEMLDSVKAGLRYLQDKCSAVLITHVDVPLFSIKTVRTLMECEGGACIPTYQGRGGHPILLGVECFQQVLDYTGENGLAGALHTLSLPRQRIAVEDEGILLNTHREYVYQHLVARHDLSITQPVFRFQLRKERVYYGPGAHQLLQMVAETGSLLDACRHMGISYTKGRKIVATLEQQMGCLAIESQQGGKTGGGSLLTEAAVELMARYDAFCAEANISLQALFSKHFPADQ